MTVMDIPRQRLGNHHLTGTPLPTPEEVVGWLGAVQAQEYGVAKWGVAQRTTGVRDADLDRLLAEGAIIRTHVMRPTWHFVLPADLRWLLKLTGPRVHALNASRYRQLALDDATLTRGHALLVDALRGGTQLTRSELAAVLAEGGIAMDGPRLAHLLMHAELEAVVCSGGRRGKQFTYALFDDRVPNGTEYDRDEALAELARRYFTSHGPATAHDFAWWSGLTVADARHGAALAGSALMEIAIDGKAYWSTATTAAVGVGEPAVHLLPVYDEYLGSYSDYSPIFDAALNDQLEPGSDTLMGNILVVDGRVIGGWKRTVKTREISITIDPLVPLGAAEHAGIEAAAVRFGVFMGLPVTVTTKR
jgi:hypothetical protein